MSKYDYYVPDFNEVIKPDWSDEEIRERTLINCQIEYPELTYDDVWGDQSDI